MSQSKTNQNFSVVSFVRQYGIWIGVVLLAILFAWFLSTSSRSGGSSDLSSFLIPAFDDHFYRDVQEGDMTIIEYSDFQCPACASHDRVLRSVLEEYDNVSLVYRHFPLESIHKYAVLSARASEAAAFQGKFWEMHSELFDNQSTWSSARDEESVTEIFVSYAQKIGLDIDQFREDLSSDMIAARVDRDAKAAGSLRLRGTPTFFVDGKEIANPSSEQEWRDLLGETL
ncbi:MAG: thioredoxin domain-containing protein [Candidatus Moranbacteria bacterium]|nr:thioredoxin domain-containing protein [Candidatus Moranbacteria bacterium]